VTAEAVIIHTKSWLHRINTVKNRLAPDPAFVKPFGTGADADVENGAGCPADAHAGSWSGEPSIGFQPIRSSRNRL
jgi:hypothetical protein